MFALGALPVSHAPENTDASLISLLVNAVSLPTEAPSQSLSTEITPGLLSTWTDTNARVTAAHWMCICKQTLGDVVLLTVVVRADARRSGAGKAMVAWLVDAASRAG